MTLCLAEREHAREVLSQIHEPKYQTEFANAILSRVNECIIKETGHPYCSYVITDFRLIELKELATKEIKNYLYDNKYNTSLYSKIFLEKIDVIITRVEKNTISIDPNSYLQQLLYGLAPVKLFSPSDEVIENMWKNRE